MNERLAIARALIEVAKQLQVMNEIHEANMKLDASQRNGVTVNGSSLKEVDDSFLEEKKD